MIHESFISIATKLCLFVHKPLFLKYVSISHSYPDILANEISLGEIRVYNSHFILFLVHRWTLFKYNVNQIKENKIHEIN